MTLGELGYQALSPRLVAPADLLIGSKMSNVALSHPLPHLVVHNEGGGVVMWHPALSAISISPNLSRGGGFGFTFTRRFSL